MRPKLFDPAGEFECYAVGIQNLNLASDSDLIPENAMFPEWP